MKLIGLLGGVSWPSTPLYYEAINRLVSERLGGFHSARILLYSIDYAPIKDLYHHGWDRIPALLEQELSRLYSYNPDCVVLCNNTLHKAYDMVRGRLPQTIPFFHVVDLAIAHAKERGFQKFLFLGTRFTMEDDFFVEPLRASGLTITVPNTSERDRIQEIQTQLSLGYHRQEFRDYFRNLLAGYGECDAVVLACTELPLAIDEETAGKPLINSITLQCRAAVDFALAEP